MHSGGSLQRIFPCTWPLYMYDVHKGRLRRAQKKEDGNEVMLVWEERANHCWHPAGGHAYGGSLASSRTRRANYGAGGITTSSM